MPPRRRQTDPVLDKLEKEVFGNGKEGLLASNIRLQGMISSLDQKLDLSFKSRDEKLDTLILQMDKFCESSEKRIRDVELEQANSKGKASQTAMIIGWIIGGIGLIFTAIKTFG